MPTLNLVTLAAPAPDAERVVAALAAASGTEPTAWYPELLPDGAFGRHCGIALDHGIEIGMSERPDRDLPRALTLTVPSIAVASERLTEAGFTVIDPEVFARKVYVKPVPGFTIRLREG